jgi:hypothetical protein
MHAYNWMYDVAVLTCFLFAFGVICYIGDTINGKRGPRAQATRVK